MRCLFVLSALAAILLLPSLSATDPTSISRARAALMDLPDFDRYKIDPYLAAAATLQAAGKEKAALILADLAGVRDRNEGRRVIVLCRMLFRAKPNSEFRRPALGAPVSVGQTKFKDWPLEPIEQIDGVPFLVVRGYSIGGYPEPAREYLDYCLKHCDWNAEAFKPKTVEEKRKALAKLVASPRWEEPPSEEAKKVLSSQIE